MPAETVIKLRRGTASEWTTADSVLAAGEMGIETDTGRSKFGDGVTAWASLSYTVGDSSGIGTIDWTSVQNKPAEFAPSAHTHSLSEITDYTFPTVLSDTAPGAPSAGLKWVKTTTMQQYIYFDSNWVEI
jgi:hypothetical protein